MPAPVVSAAPRAGGRTGRPDGRIRFAPSGQHPIAATGAVITTKILYEMERKQQDLGLVTLCIGGGQGTAMLIERAKPAYHSDAQGAS